ALLEEIGAAYGALERPRAIHELVRRVITRFIEDVVEETRRRIARVAPTSAADVRNAGAPLVAFSPAMAAADGAIKAFLFSNMYRHEKVMGVWEKASRVISRLFAAFFDDPALMPAEWAGLAGARAGEERARIVADYIAGMTDRYALGEYARLFGEKVEVG
ncbi:MAG: deoxyguanosinetriphosphate triphosphohydrolase, partial [Methylocystis sp.]|nr:deoxyguanosinetriphosphate triphosphohydrolase [Methylocystis sp.]